MRITAFPPEALRYGVLGRALNPQSNMRPSLRRDTPAAGERLGLSTGEASTATSATTVRIFLVEHFHVQIMAYLARPVKRIVRTLELQLGLAWVEAGTVELFEEPRVESAVAHDGAGRVRSSTARPYP